MLEGGAFITMPTPTESAELILKLYELRREPVLREARAWFTGALNAATREEFGQMVREKDAWFRMVVSYWDMAASLVTFKAIDREMFNASNGELFGVFAKIEPFLDQMRTKWNMPDYLTHLEQVARQFPNAETRLQQAQEHFRAMAVATDGTASRSDGERPGPSERQPGGR